MENNLTFLISIKYDKCVISKFLREEANLSSRFIKKAKVEGRIKVNDNIIKMNYILKLGDVVTVNLARKESQNIEPENIPIDVVYEDEDILVVNKAPYMVVHPTKSHQSGTLANGLINYFNNTNQDCIVRLVSRLDMDTSGLIIIAKNQFSHAILAEQMCNKEIFKKSYMAIVHHNLKNKIGTINQAIYRPAKDTIKRVVDNEHGQKSITHYEVVQSFKDADLVKLLLETGRTHQIRVHMNFLGHPIFGDSLYCDIDDKDLIKRQALHAYRLEFYHPKNNKKIVLEVPLPHDMKELIKRIELSSM